MATLRQENPHVYMAWKAMKQRCLNPNSKPYHNYGGRGIKVCDEWMEFAPFCEWSLNNGYAKGLDLDRIDNDGNYCPENCRWTSRRNNTNNRRKTIFLTVDGVTKPRTEWEEELNLTKGIIKSWVLKHGQEYAVDRIREVMKYGYQPEDYNRNHISFPVQCLETGLVYPSVSKAAKANGLNQGNLLQSILRHGTTNGFHFVFVNDLLDEVVE